MSYASASTLNPLTATRDQMIGVFKTDLPLGWQALEKLVAECRPLAALAASDCDPAVAKQLLRLFAYDVPRGIVEQEFGVTLGLARNTFLVSRDRAGLSAYLTLQYEFGVEVGSEETALKILQDRYPLGWRNISEMAGKAHLQDHAWFRRSPTSEEGLEGIYLLGHDIPRALIQKHFDVKVGMLNCHKPVAVKQGGDLTPFISIAEQIREQNGENASADC